MSIKSLIKSGCIAMAATCLLMGTAIAANETPQKVTSSTPEGVTYGVDQKYKAPPDTSRYANIKTAAGCVVLLVLIGFVPFIVTRAGKRKEKDGNSEKKYVETSHKEAVHRIVDTNQRYRAYIEQSNDKGYNLVVVGTNGYWTGNFPDEEHAHRFAYENGIELD